MGKIDLIRTRQRLCSPLARTLRSALLGTVALGIAAPALAQGSNDALVQQLLQEVRELRQRQEELERQLEQQRAARRAVSKSGEAVEVVEVVPENVVVGGERPGTFVLPGIDTEVRIGGYVKGDLIYDADAELGDLFVLSNIPAEGTVEATREGKFRAHARQSRVNINTWTPTALGEMHTLVEGDFFGGGGNEVISNSTSFRLRHAFGELGPLLVGQTWSLFMHPATLPPTLDFQGPTGVSFIRQGQLRYTHDFTPEFSAAVSVENSEFSGRDFLGRVQGSQTSGAILDGLRVAMDSAPDVVGALMWQDDIIDAKVAGIFRHFDLDRIDNVTGFGFPLTDDTSAWGVQAAAAIHPFRGDPIFGDDTIYLSGAFGDGIGRYLLDGPTQDAFINEFGQLETIESWGAMVGLTHHWLDNLSSTVAYGRQEFDSPTFLTGAAGGVAALAPGFNGVPGIATPTVQELQTEVVQSVHGNLVWSPVEKVSLGMEAMYGKREFENGLFDNDVVRFQFAGQWNFP